MTKISSFVLEFRQFVAPTTFQYFVLSCTYFIRISKLSRRYCNITNPSITALMFLSFLLC